MTTRYTSRSIPRFGVAGLPSGYDGNISSSDLHIPSVGITDVDRALFDLFNEQIPLIIGGKDQESRRVPIVFFAGEKWALNKRFKALRDHNNSLILPLVTAVRTTVVQDPVNDLTGRGINQQTGEIVVHRRLDRSDRAYQNLINKTLLRNQMNVAVNPSIAETGQLTTLREQGELADDPVILQGGLLASDRRNNIFETIVLPTPQFFTAQYDFTLWSQYSSHMNQMIEAIISSFLPQGYAWKLTTPTGYWFMATVDANTFTADTNVDDFSAEERLIKYKFIVKVPAYILATNTPGAPIPIKRYVSSPSISFETSIGGSISTDVGAEDEPFLGSDDPTLPIEHDRSGETISRDQRRTNGTRLYPGKDQLNAGDPALSSRPRGAPLSKFKKIRGIDKNGKSVVRYLRVKNTNRFTGETVFAPDANLDGLSIIVVDD